MNGQLRLCPLLQKEFAQLRLIPKVYDEHGNPSRAGAGIFPRAVMQRFPLLPLEEEGRLNDLPLRENFIERVFYHPELAREPITAGPRWSRPNQHPAGWSASTVNDPQLRR